MNTPPPPPPPPTAASWHVIETGDRWYQAILRFTLAASAPAQCAIHRWDPASADQMLGWIGQQHVGPSVLLWEVAAEPSAALWTLDLIATAGRVNPQAIQLANVPAHHRDALVLAVQEAGATLLLDDLWSLERFVRRWSGRHLGQTVTTVSNQGCF